MERSFRSRGMSGCGQLGVNSGLVVCASPFATAPSPYGSATVGFLAGGCSSCFSFWSVVVLTVTSPFKRRLWLSSTVVVVSGCCLLTVSPLSGGRRRAFSLSTVATLLLSGSCSRFRPASLPVFCCWVSSF